MTANPFASIRRLYERGPTSRGLAVDRDGVMLGPNCILVQRTEGGYRCAPTDQVATIARAISAADAPLHRLPVVLGAIADALDAGDLVKAQLLGLEIPIGVLDDQQLARVAVVSDLAKAGFDPNQPRDDHGRWTDGGSNGTGDAGAPTRIADAGEERTDAGGILPVTDTRSGSPEKLNVDSALLTHRGDKENSESTLRVGFYQGRYVVGLLIANEDKSAWPAIDTLRDGLKPLNLDIDTTIRSNNGTYSKHYNWTITLPVGGTAHVAMFKDIAPMEGPGSIEMHVKNLGPYDTGVTLRVTRIDNDGGGHGK